MGRTGSRGHLRAWCLRRRGRPASPTPPRRSRHTSRARRWTRSAEEEAAAALGAGELSQADLDRISELEDIARRWAGSSEPLWTSLLDPDAAFEDFVPLFEAARDDLAGTASDFDAAVESLDDPGLAEAIRPFAKSLRDQLAGFEQLTIAVTSVDDATVDGAAQQLNNVLSEGHKAQDAMLAGLRAYIDEGAYSREPPRPRRRAT